MTRIFGRALHGVILLSIAAAALGAPAAAPQTDAKARFGALTIPFVANEGQLPAAVRFQASTIAGTLLVMDDGSMRHVLAPHARKAADAVARDHSGAGSGATFVESFAGRGATPRGGGRSATNVSFLRDTADRHRAHVATYHDVRLDDAFPGVDVVLRATGSNVEKIYTVAPGRDPDAIRMRIDEARSLRVAGDGTLVVDTGEGDVSFTAPVAFQLAADGVRQPVGVAYRLDSAAQEYGFELGAYDRKRALVIDPLIRATFLGGGGQEGISAIAIHPTTGDVYVTGGTTSSAADISPPYSTPPALPCVTPVTAGCQNGAQTNYGGSFDCFVGRLNAGLTNFLQLTYVGGNQEDSCTAIAIAPDGLSVYVAGRTSSTTPPVGGGAQSAHSANLFNAFVARLTSSLTSYLAWSYFGGTGGAAFGEDGYGLAISPLTGDVVFVGQATSTAGLPGVGVGSVQQNISGTSDAFIARFNASLTTVNATYFGGTGADSARAVAFHPGSNDLYVIGQASSALPQIAKGAQTTFAGGSAGFVARFAPDLSFVHQSTFIGGNESSTWGNAIAFHPATGDPYVGGATQASALLGVGSGYQSFYGGNRDPFVAWLDPGLKILYRATYYGGASEDEARGIAIHPVTHEVYIAGHTSGLASGTSGGIQSSSNGQTEGYIARFSPDLTMLGKATYFGGNSSEGFSALAISPLTGDVYAAGGSLSGTLTGTTGAAQTTGDTTNGNALIVAATPDLAFSDITPDPFTFQPNAGVAPGSLQMSNPALITGIVDPAPAYITGAPGAAFCISMMALCNCDVSLGFIPANVSAQISNNRYVCVRHNAPIASPAVNSSTLHVGGAAGTFYVGTGAPLGGNCTLDVDGNGTPDALTDGLMVLRALFGLTGTAVTNNAVGGGATRDEWPEIRAFLNGNCGTSLQP